MRDKNPVVFERYVIDGERMRVETPSASELAGPPLLEPAIKTPRTMRCWRDGRWHADELANLSANLERENAQLEATINTLHGLCVSAEKRAFQKLKEEAAAAGSNSVMCDTTSEASSPNELEAKDL